MVLGQKKSATDGPLSVRWTCRGPALRVGWGEVQIVIHVPQIVGRGQQSERG